jgi:hypothetical protein
MSPDGGCTMQEVEFAKFMEECQVAEEGSARCTSLHCEQLYKDMRNNPSKAVASEASKQLLETEQVNVP